MRYLFGGLTCAAGVGAFLYGAYLGAVVTSDGAHSHYFPAFVLVVVGMFLVAFGAWVCGADVDWRSWRDN